MWPDFGIKSCPIFLKNAQNGPHQFYLKSDIFKNNSKCFQLFGLHLLEKLSPRLFKNIPIRSHCSSTAPSFSICRCCCWSWRKIMTSSDDDDDDPSDWTQDHRDCGRCKSNVARDLYDVHPPDARLKDFWGPRLLKMDECRIRRILVEASFLESVWTTSSASHWKEMYDGARFPT